MIVTSSYPVKGYRINIKTLISVSSFFFFIRKPSQIDDIEYKYFPISKPGLYNHNLMCETLYEFYDKVEMKWMSAYISMIMAET